MDDTCDWLSTAEAAAYMATSQRTVDRLVEWGLVPAYRSRSLILIRRDDVAALLPTSCPSSPSISVEGGGGRGPSWRPDPWDRVRAVVRPRLSA
jgi:excisionase family DNA binding protein